MLHFDLPEIDPRQVAAADAELEEASLEAILRYAAARLWVDFTTAIS